MGYPDVLVLHTTREKKILKIFKKGLLLRYFHSARVVSHTTTMIFYLQFLMFVLLLRGHTSHIQEHWCDSHMSSNPPKMFEWQLLLTVRLRPAFGLLMDFSCIAAYSLGQPSRSHKIFIWRYCKPLLFRKAFKKTFLFGILDFSVL